MHLKGVVVLRNCGDGRRWRRKLTRLVVRTQLVDDHLIRMRLHTGVERRRRRVEAVHLMDGRRRHSELLLGLRLRHGRRWQRLVLDESGREGVMTAAEAGRVWRFRVFQLRHLSHVVRATDTAGRVSNVVRERCSLLW